MVKCERTSAGRRPRDMQSLFCARCGLEAPIAFDSRPCTACGGKVFVPARFLDWDASLTEQDRAFLKTNKIADT